MPELNLPVQFLLPGTRPRLDDTHQIENRRSSGG
jgi:hypothetical protein